MTINTNFIKVYYQNDNKQTLRFDTDIARICELVVFASQKGDRYNHIVSDI